MIGEPLVALLLRTRPEIRCDGDRFILFESKIRHPGARTEKMRILDPTDHPIGVNLSANSAQAGTDFRKIFVSFNQVTTGTADLLEQTLPLRQKRRILERLHVEVTRHAVALHLGVA